MASYVEIYFDRTKPEVEINAPNYTIADITNEITVVANEPLSTYQDFYIVDSDGGIHNYTFTQSEPNIYTGLIRLNTMPLGIVTLYGKVRDSVDNESDLVMATIEIKDSVQILKMTETHRTMPVSLADKARLVKHTESEIEVRIKERGHVPKVGDRTRKVETKQNPTDIDSH